MTISSCAMFENQQTVDVKTLDEKLSGLLRRGYLPGHAVHGLFVDWRHHEADGGHCSLTARMIKNLPFEGLGVVEECTLITFMDSDLVENQSEREFQDFEINTTTLGCQL